MGSLKRKQFILSQDKLNRVKKVLHARTDTEAVILSLDSVLRQKKLQKFAELRGKITLSLTANELESMRRDSD